MNLLRSIPNVRLKTLRHAHKIPQIVLAVEASVSPRIISSIEQHGYIPSAKTRHRIAKVFGVDVSEIWPEDTSKTIAT